MTGRLFSVAAVLLFATAQAQERVGPPSCAGTPPVSRTVPGDSFHPVEANRPSVEAARRTAESEASDASVLVAAEPMENFGVARYRVKDYADCVGEGGCYWTDVQAQINRASSALQTALSTPYASGAKLAIVLDIDETVLSSYCEMSKEDYGYIPEMFNTWVVTPQAAVPIPGMLALYNKARAAGVAVFFLTGRPDEQRAATERNLRAVGYSGWSGLILRNADEKKLPTVAYKSGERAKIVAQGYRLIMSVGDQWSDLTGSPRAEISVKLPNPFYYLP